MGRGLEEMGRLGGQLDRIAGLLREEPDPTPLRVERVSRWTIADQLEHLLKVLDRALDHLGSSPATLGRGINLTGRVILALGRIPRGVGRSPATVLPEGRTRAELGELLDRVRGHLRSLAAQAEVWRGRRPVTPHPYFGGLTPRQSLRFLTVHTDHHLRIVADIRRAAGR